MENSDTPTPATPMGRVWLIVLLSMALTFGASWIWHMSGMNERARQYKVADDAIRESTEAVTRYRDILKAEGTKAAEAYLVASSTPPLW